MSQARVREESKEQKSEGEEGIEEGDGADSKSNIRE